MNRNFWECESRRRSHYIVHCANLCIHFFLCRILEHMDGQPKLFHTASGQEGIVPHKFSLADTIHTSYVDCMSYTRCRHLWAPTSRDHNCIATKIERKVSCLLQQHIRRGSSVEHTCRILMKQTGHCSQVAQFFNTLQIIIGFRA